MLTHLFHRRILPLILLTQLSSQPALAGDEKSLYLPWIVMAMRMLYTGLDIHAAREPPQADNVRENLHIIRIPGHHNNCFFNAIRNGGIVDFSRQAVIELLNSRRQDPRFQEAVQIGALLELISQDTNELAEFLRPFPSAEQPIFSRIRETVRADVSNGTMNLSPDERTALYNLFIRRLQAGSPMPFEGGEPGNRANVITLLGEHFGFNLRIITGRTGSALPHPVLRDFQTAVPTRPTQNITLLWTPGDIGHFDLVADPTLQKNVVSHTRSSNRLPNVFPKTILGNSDSPNSAYRITKLLGWGSFANVYQVKDKVGNTLAAKLIYPAPLNQHPNSREAAFMTSVRHPGVMRLLDVFYGPAGFCLLIMPQATSSLSQVGVLSEEQVVHSLIELLAAIDAIHRLGIIHRDIKPENILITSNNTLAIADFGLAIWTQEGATAEAAGSPLCLAPEVYYKKPQTKAADLWSLGATLYTLISGYSPYIRKRTEEPLKFLARIFPHNATIQPPVRPIAHPTSEGLWDIISGFLQPRPSQRLSIGGALRTDYLSTRRSWILERARPNSQWVAAIVALYENHLAIPRELLGHYLGILLVETDSPD